MLNILVTKLLGKYLSSDTEFNLEPETEETSGEKVSDDKGGPIVSKWADDEDLCEVAIVKVHTACPSLHIEESHWLHSKTLTYLSLVILLIA